MDWIGHATLRHGSMTSGLDLPHRARSPPSRSAARACTGPGAVGGAEPARLHRASVAVGHSVSMSAWGRAVYGDPCRECGYEWSITPADAIGVVVETPQRYATLLEEVTGLPRSGARLVSRCVRLPCRRQPPHLGGTAGGSRSGIERRGRAIRRGSPCASSAVRVDRG